MAQSFLAAAVESYNILGEQVDVMLTADMTGGKTSLVVETTPPGGGPPPHVHTEEDETLTVLEGRFEFLCNGEWRSMDVGDVAFIPRHTIHTFRNVGDGPGKIAAAFFPAGFERFFGIVAEGLTLENAADRLKAAGDSVGTAFLL